MSFPDVLILVITWGVAFNGIRWAWGGGPTRDKTITEYFGGGTERGVMYYGPNHAVHFRRGRAARSVALPA